MFTTGITQELITLTWLIVLETIKTREKLDNRTNNTGDINLFISRRENLGYITDSRTQDIGGKILGGTGFTRNIMGGRQWEVQY